MVTYDNLASIHCPILSKNDLYKSGFADKSVDPYQKTNGVVLGKRDDDDAYDCGLIFSIVTGDAVIVPGMESKFCDTSKSTSNGFLPNLVAIESWEIRVKKKRQK